MIKKLIFTSIIGMHLCALHIKAHEMDMPQSSEQIQTNNDSNESTISSEANESTPDFKSEPVHLYRSPKSFGISFLIAFCVDLAFMMHKKSPFSDPC
jgi:hypothetical protein